MRAGLLLLLLLTPAVASRSQGAQQAPVVTCQAQMFEGSRFTVCDPGSGRIELFAAARNESPIRQLTDLEIKLGSRAGRRRLRHERRHV